MKIAVGEERRLVARGDVVIVVTWGVGYVCLLGSIVQGGCYGAACCYVGLRIVMVGYRCVSVGSLDSGFCARGLGQDVVRVML